MSTYNNCVPQVSGERDFFAKMVVDAVTTLDPRSVDLRMLGIKKVQVGAGWGMGGWLGWMSALPERRVSQSEDAGLGAGPACSAHCWPALPCFALPCPALCHFPCIGRLCPSSLMWHLILILSKLSCRAAGCATPSWLTEWPSRRPLATPALRCSPRSMRWVLGAERGFAQ